MRRYLFDTGPFSAYVLGRPVTVAVMAPMIAAGEAATSIVVYGEVGGYLKSHREYVRYRRVLRQLLREAVYPYRPTYMILERYADIRRALRPPYGPGLIGDIDTLIAATALVHDLTVVTMDGDFGRVPGLRVQLLPRAPEQIVPSRVQ